MGSRFIADKRSVLHFWHMLGNRIITFVFNVLNNICFINVLLTINKIILWVEDNRA